jgi:hypothetical protein
MRQVGNRIFGDFVKVENFTKQWSEVDVDPLDLDTKDLLLFANKSRGYFADLSDGDTACLRFSNPDDAARFIENYHGA